MIVEVNGHLIDTDAFIIRALRKIIEVKVQGRWLKTLTYDEGTSPSDGCEQAIDLLR